MIMEYLEYGAVALPSNWTGSEIPDMSQQVFLPHIDLMLPAINKVGKIAMLIKDKNPILLQMDDDTQLYFTHDQFRRITGTPEIGRTISVVFQRDYTDRSKRPSQISSCQVT